MEGLLSSLPTQLLSTCLLSVTQQATSTYYWTLSLTMRLMILLSLTEIDMFMSMAASIIGRPHVGSSCVLNGRMALLHGNNCTTTWEQLIDLKQLYRLELAEYAIAQGINKTPAFAWWMRDRESKLVGLLVIVASYCCQDLLLNRALEIDKEDGNTLWQDAIAKEMANVRVAFKVLPDGSKEPVGHQYMDCHLVYEIKLD